MDRHTDIEGKCPVVEHVYGEEHRRVESPFPERHSGFLEEERPIYRELRGIRRQRYDKKLSEGDEKASCTLAALLTMVKRVGHTTALFAPEHLQYMGRFS